MTPPLDLARRSHAMLTRAMEHDPPDRRAFVRDACVDDPALLERVLALLDAADRSGTFLGEPALERSNDLDETLPDAVGSYTVVGVLGVGGMATVYEAIQEHPKRRVALKVLHQSMARTEAYNRFRFETEALARLHHPGIAQIYEAGAARLGQATPSLFFAMEIIPEAVPITDYARCRNLGLRERIGMLAMVCDAVHHGHQHGVIHRDIKPGNVLVDAEGRPKVIDFGIARATDPGADSPTTTADARQLLGTLNHMSPEQCTAAADIDSRTDVYSLGVLLYELLTDRLPHDLTGLPLPAALHAIMHDRPIPPGLSAHGNSAALEAIVLKSIEKDPERRYDSASALAADLRRWLDHRPTEARPPSVIEQAILFAQRNRGIVAAGIAIAAGIVAIATISTVFAIRLTDEVKHRRAAELQTISERDEARWQAYVAQIAGALSGMKAGEFVQMRSRLAAASHPKRGWELGFLNRLADRSQIVVQAHEDMIFDMAFSPDRSRLVTGSSDGTIRLWNGGDLAPIASRRGEGAGRIFAVRFTHDVRHVITGCDKGLLTLHDAGTLEPLTRIAELPSGIRTIAVLPDGRLVVATADGTAMMWRDDFSEQSPFPHDQPGGINGIERSECGTMLATYNDEGHLWIRRTSDLSVLQQMEFPAGINQVRFSPDSTMIGGVGNDVKLLVWRTSDGQLGHEFDVTEGVGSLRSLVFTHDGQFVVGGLTHRGIVVCSLLEGKVVGGFGGHSDAVAAVSISPDDKTLISASWDRTMRVWHMQSHASPPGSIDLAGHEHHVLDAAFSPDGSFVASASRDGAVLIWDPDLARPIARLSAEPHRLNAIAISPDGSLIAAGATDGTVHLWNGHTGEALLSIGAHDAWVASVAFHPDGTRIVTGSQDRTARVWSLETREQLHLFEGFTDRVNAVRFSPDGSLIATGSRDKSVRLYDADTGQLLHDMPFHRSDVFAVLFSHDGRYLYSGCRDQSIGVWDIETGERVRVLDGHGQYITCLAMNADATRLAAGSWFGEILLYDVETHDLIASFRAHDAAIRGIAFSPDGRWLASASLDHSVRLFDSATRDDADAAGARARAAYEAAVNRIAEDPDAGAAALTDPWVRKALLNRRVPPEPHTEHQPTLATPTTTGAAAMPSTRPRQ